jgi:hypothetical protein
MADQADLARELLGLAADDLMAARALVDVPSVSDAIVGFHAQQAAEKTLASSFQPRSTVSICSRRTVWLGATARGLPAPWNERRHWIWRRRRWLGHGRSSRSRPAQGHPTRISIPLGCKIRG